MCIRDRRIPDRPLRICPTCIEGNLMEFVSREFGSSENEAHLGPVAMGDRDVPPCTDQFDDVLIGLAGRKVLIFHRAMLGVLDQRVAANGHDGKPTFGSAQRISLLLDTWYLVPGITSSAPL